MKKKPSKWIKWGAAALIAAVGVGALLLPLPTKIERQLSGAAFAGAPDEEMTPCEVCIQGTLYRYLIRPDVFDGRLTLSCDPRTAHRGAHLNTDITREHVSPLTYVYDSGTPQQPGVDALGYFLSDDALNWVYVRLKDEQGAVRDVAAPAQTPEQALALRELAAARTPVGVLPEY
jgi:hypothetical protein